MTDREPDPIDVALREDIGEGDITTQLVVPENAKARARVIPREKAVIAGTSPAAEVFRRVDAQLEVRIALTDGTAVLGGETILEIGGSARSISARDTWHRSRHYPVAPSLDTGLP